MLPFYGKYLYIDLSERRYEERILSRELFLPNTGVMVILSQVQKN